MAKSLKISFIVDDPDSWITPFVRDLVDDLSKQHNCKLYHNAGDIPAGDMLFILGCVSMLSVDVLKRNKHNLVVHESDLPRGRGFAPVAWQVLEGAAKIPTVIFEAQEQMDSGMIYLKDYMELDGSELLPEIRRKQAAITHRLVCEIVCRYPDLAGEEQVGESTFFPRRTREHDELDINKTLKDNFNHLRILDNDRYPAWFQDKGHKYVVKIYKEPVA